MNSSWYHFAWLKLKIMKWLCFVIAIVVFISHSEGLRNLLHSYVKVIVDKHFLSPRTIWLRNKVIAMLRVLRIIALSNHSLHFIIFLVFVFPLIFEGNASSKLLGSELVFMELLYLLNCCKVIFGSLTYIL